MHFSHRDEKKEEFLEQSLSLDREVITVGLGTCGNRMSTGFWRNILDEHNLDFDGSVITDNADEYVVDNTRIGTYFRELRDSGNYVPRNLICDLDVTTIDSVRASNLGSLFSADSYIYAGNSANNLYCLGFNSVIIDDMMEEIRSEAEKCSSIQGFNLLHSVGGGTGSGLTAYLSQLIKDEYYDRIITSYTVYPSTTASDIVIEPYNMMLSLPSLLSYHDLNCVIDNETLFDISSRLFKRQRPAFSDLNEYVCNIISSSTAGLRFKGSLNMDLRKLTMNLVPFPRLKFMSISDAPLMYDHARKYTKISIASLVSELFHSHQFLCGNGSADDFEFGKYLAASVIFRGAPVNKYNIKLNEWEIANGLRKTMDELYTQNLVAHNVNILHSTLVYQPSCSYPLTGTLFANNTSIKELFQRNLAQFNKFWRRKAHLQYYLDNGTLEEDFHEAINDCKDVIQEYNDKDDSSMSSALGNEFKIDTANRKKLKKNNVFWSQFGGSAKKRKKKKKPKKIKNSKRVVIMSNKRRKQLEMKAKRKKRIEAAKKKRQKRRKKRNRRKQRYDSSSDSSDDFEEESSSHDSTASDDDDDGSSSASGSGSRDSSNDSSSGGGGDSSSGSASNDTDDDHSSDTSSSSAGAASSSSSSHNASSDSQNSNSDSNDSD